MWISSFYPVFYGDGCRIRNEDSGVDASRCRLYVFRSTLKPYNNNNNHCLYIFSQYLCRPHIYHIETANEQSRTQRRMNDEFDPRIYKYIWYLNGFSGPEWQVVGFGESICWLDIWTTDWLCQDCYWTGRTVYTLYVTVVDWQFILRGYYINRINIYMAKCMVWISKSFELHIRFSWKYL